MATVPLVVPACHGCQLKVSAQGVSCRSLSLAAEAAALERDNPQALLRPIPDTPPEVPVAILLAGDPNLRDSVRRHSS